MKNVKQVKAVTHTKPGLVRLQASVLPSTAMEIRVQAAKVGSTLGLVIDSLVASFLRVAKGGKA